MDTSHLSPERTIMFSNELMNIVVEMTDEGLMIENIREIIEADIINLNGLLLMYPAPAFYQCLEQRYQMNETMLNLVEGRLEELEREVEQNLVVN